MQSLPAETFLKGHTTHLHQAVHLGRVRSQVLGLRLCKVPLRLETIGRYDEAGKAGEPFDQGKHPFARSL